MKTRRSFIRLTGMAALGGLGSGVIGCMNEAIKDAGAGITFFGAAGRVSGSMALVTLPGDKAIIDCGAFYDEGGNAATQNVEMPVEALDASFLLLTHAHADHVGRISLLMERGFKGMIAATKPTLALLEVMLMMGARYSDRPDRTWTWSGRRNTPAGKIAVFTLHWHPECKWFNAISLPNRQIRIGRDDEGRDDEGDGAEHAISLPNRQKGNWAELKKRIWRDKAEASPCKVCAAHEVEPILSRCKALSVGKPFRIGTHTTVTAIQAGHLPGSVSFHLECEWPGGKKCSMLVSGDLGPKQPMLQQGFGEAPAADAIVVECTYGVSPSVNRDADLANFRNRLISHLKRGTLVWVPCFALDRTEKVLMQIEIALREAGSELPRPPEVYVPSPSANVFHDLYRKGGESWGLHKGYLDLEGRTRKGGPAGFHDRMPDQVLRFLDATKAREMGLTGFGDPVGLAPAAMRSLAGNIILTTSGMISEAFSEAIFKPLARLESTAIFLVGYQDPQSTGGKLKEAMRAGRRFLEIAGEEIEIKATVENFSGFSGHANAVEIDEWLRGQSRDAKLFLVHGQPERLLARRTDLVTQGWRDVSIPTHRQHFDL